MVLLGRPDLDVSHRHGRVSAAILASAIRFLRTWREPVGRSSAPRQIHTRGERPLFCSAALLVASRRLHASRVAARCNLTSCIWRCYRPPSGWHHIRPGEIARGDSPSSARSTARAHSWCSSQPAGSSRQHVGLVARGSSGREPKLILKAETRTSPLRRANFGREVGKWQVFAGHAVDKVNCPRSAACRRRYRPHKRTTPPPAAEGGSSFR